MSKDKKAYKSSLTEMTYHFLRENIMSNEYPPGAPIIESHVIEQLKVSRTPFRRAIQQLEQEKLVQIFPKRGAFVTQIPLVMIKEIFEIRGIIEPIIAHNVTKNITQATLDEISDIQERLLEIRKVDPINSEKAREVGRELDEVIIAAFSNQTLIELMETLNTYMDRGCALVGRGDNHSRVLIEQHLSIIETIKKKDADKTKKLMKEHISYAQESLFLS